MKKLSKLLFISISLLTFMNGNKLLSRCGASWDFVFYVNIEANIGEAENTITCGGRDYEYGVDKQIYDITDSGQRDHIGYATSIDCVEGVFKSGQSQYHAVLESTYERMETHYSRSENYH